MVERSRRGRWSQNWVLAKSKATGCLCHRWIFDRELIAVIYINKIVRMNTLDNFLSLKMTQRMVPDKYREERMTRAFGRDITNV